MDEKLLKKYMSGEVDKKRYNADNTKTLFPASS